MDFSSITTPDSYDETAFLSREIAKEMLARLELMNIQPKQVLDLGCGTGREAEQLAQRYPQSQVWGVDLAQSFLEYGKKQGRAQLAWMLADGHTLPLRSHTVDLIFANLLLPWTADPALILREWRRVLRPEGLVLFSCLGPDTFKEWSAEQQGRILPGLVDMHNVGDALLEQGFVDPVLEVENLIFNYRSEEQCLAELVQSGLCRTAGEGGHPLTLVQSDLSSVGGEGKYPLTFEVVYGHAWCPTAKSGFKPDAQGVVKIPVSQLKRST